MGWAICENSQSRTVGYGVEAMCDEAGCSTGIDRGLAYVCGDMHDGGDDGCGKYFCYPHLIMTEAGQLCEACADRFEEDDEE